MFGYIFCLLASSSSNIAVSNEADEWEEVGHKNKSTITRVVCGLEYVIWSMNFSSGGFL